MLLLVGGYLLGYKVVRTWNSTVYCLRMSNFSSAILRGLHLLKSIYRSIQVEFTLKFEENLFWFDNETATLYSCTCRWILVYVVHVKYINSTYLFSSSNESYFLFLPFYHDLYSIFAIILQNVLQRLNQVSENKETL